MIKYQLLCEHDHGFEAWFKDSTAYEDQVAMGEIECPFCGNIRIRKAVMAPSLARTRHMNEEQGERQLQAISAAENAAQEMREGADPQDVAERFLEIVTKIQKHVQDNCDYVGEQFADEARAMHYGDAEIRGIYGEATPEETEDLLEEGIEIVRLPIPAKGRTN